MLAVRSPPSNSESTKCLRWVSRVPAPVEGSQVNLGSLNISGVATGQKFRDPSRTWDP